jgi:hypothetical protein
MLTPTARAITRPNTTKSTVLVQKRVLKTPA